MHVSCLFTVCMVNVLHTILSFLCLIFSFFRVVISWKAHTQSCKIKFRIQYDSAPLSVKDIWVLNSLLHQKIWSHSLCNCLRSVGAQRASNFPWASTPTIQPNPPTVPRSNAPTRHSRIKAISGLILYQWDCFLCPEQIVPVIKLWSRMAPPFTWGQNTFASFKGYAVKWHDYKDVRTLAVESIPLCVFIPGPCIMHKEVAKGNNDLSGT